MSAGQLKFIDFDDIKRCTSCKKVKRISEFYYQHRGKRKLEARCKSCTKEAHSILAKSHKDKGRKRAKKFYSSEKGKIASRNNRFRTVGIKNADGSQFKVHDYNVLYAQQNGKCAICENEKINKKSNHLFVDHDHKTGFVRWLLCNACNLMLGNAKDNPDVLEKAAKILRQKN